MNSNTVVQEDSWLFVAEIRELAEGERRVVAGPDEDILVVNADGIILAVTNQCSHQALPLNEGILDGDLITCPYHNAQFCLRTGEALSAPAYEPIGCYDIKIENDRIYVASEPRSI